MAELGAAASRRPVRQKRFHSDADQCHGRRAKPWPAPCRDICGQAGARIVPSGSFPEDEQLREPPNNRVHNVAPEPVATKTIMRRWLSMSPTGSPDHG